MHATFDFTNLKQLIEKQEEYLMGYVLSLIHIYVLLVFPSQHKTNKTVQILKTPKTESSIRKVFLPKSVANMLVERCV